MASSEVLFRQCGTKPALVPSEEFATLLIDLTSSEDSLWNGVQQRTREYISSAEKQNVEISFVRQDSDFRAYEFISRFIEHKAFGSPPPRSFYRAYTKSCLISTARLAGATMVIHFYLVDDSISRARLMWSARDLESDTSRFNKLLHWKDLLHLKNSLKMKTYDFGGLGMNKEEVAGIDRFKMHFGGTVVTEYDFHWFSPFYSGIKKILGR